MKRERRKWTAAALAAVMTVTLLPFSAAADPQAEKAGVPYSADGTYDVAIPHIIVNQVYGGSDDGAASHSFVELYNPVDTEVDLTGWTLQYKSSPDGDSAGWDSLELSGTIQAGGYYLIRCGKTDGTDYLVPAGNQEWDLQLHNKGVSVALFDQAVTLDDSFAGAVTEENRPEGYVDLLAVQGNDEEEAQMPPVYEGSAAPEQSKKKAVRRVNFTDTDDNTADIEVIDYSDPVEEDKGPHGMEAVIPEPTPEAPQSPEYTNTGFETGAALTLERTGQMSIGEANADGGVAEIVAYDTENQKAYVVDGQDGVLVKMDLLADGSLADPEEIQVKDLIDGFAYGDMTSVSVDPATGNVAVALQNADFAAPGRVAVLDSRGNLLDSYTVGAQPDMLTYTKDGGRILTANEGEPREGLGGGAADPAGSVSVIDVQAGIVKTAGFESFTAEELLAEGVLLGKADGQVIPPSLDLEPEYIAVNGEGTKAYVTLQEANAIGVLDLETASFTAVKGLGFVDYSREENAADLIEDNAYAPKTYENTLGVRMPDGIGLYEVNGQTYLLTANEGDAREWGDYENTDKTTVTATDGTEAEKVETLLPEYVAGLEENTHYLLGGRSFSVFDENLNLVYDSGNDFEEKTAGYLGEWFNCSNDDLERDSRSRKKGPEAESITQGRVGNNTYAFVALERVGGVMVYDITDPDAITYVNYINTRDFSGEIAGDVAPEGLCFVSANDSASGKPVLLAACEVSGTVAAYTMGGAAAEVPAPEDAVILYTNDVHCAMDGYSSLAAYRQQMLEAGYDTVTVDVGDAIQGEAVGSLTEGAALVDLMNTVPYDFAVPGNHEFDYTLETFLDLARNQAQYEYLSANFVDLLSGETVFKPYEIVEMGGRDVAFVGISTPETYTKSTPSYFQDENGNFIYSFCEDDLYQVVQSAVDGALAKGADLVVALGHLGIEGTTEGWKSTDVIANTTGIDAFIDAHAHETIPEAEYANKDGEMIPLTSTGTKFANFGKLVIGADGSITTELITPASVDTDSSQTVQSAYQAVQDKIDGYYEDTAYLNEKLGTSEVELTINDPETGERRIRSGETNMGDFVADAYRTIAGADIALVNGGGIRDSIGAGEVTRKDLMDVNPWNNAMCVIEATGQQILDALEHGARNNPEENGGFLQVSGLTYEINLHVEESPVVTDSMDLFQSVDDGKPRRVQNVRIGGEAIDPEKNYTVAGSVYTLQEAGDGFTMFQGAKVVKQEGMPCDSEMLIRYFTETLGGNVTAEQYGTLTGEGRIKVLAADSEEAHRYEETGRTEPTGEKEGKVTYVCSLCGKEKTEVLEKLPVSGSGTHTGGVDTGDNFPAARLAVALVGGAALTAALMRYKKKYPAR